MFYVTNYCRTGALGWWEINGFDRIPRFKLLSFGFIFYFSVVSVIKRRDRFASRTDKIWFRPKGIVEITFLYINCLSSVFNSAQNIFNKQIFDYVLFVFSNLINLLMNLLKSINVMNTCRDYFIEWRYFSFMVKKNHIYQIVEIREEESIVHIRIYKRYSWIRKSYFSVSPPERIQWTDVLHRNA